MQPKVYRASIPRIFKWACVKKNLLLADFYKAFDSKRSGEMKQILRANGIPKETAKTIMI